jgi:hypothetical protein
MGVSKPPERNYLDMVDMRPYAFRTRATRIVNIACLVHFLIPHVAPTVTSSHTDMHSLWSWAVLCIR